MGLSIRLISMLHSNIEQTNFIGHNFVGVYKTTPIGNLEDFMVSNMLPLQQAFQCNILTCISIGIDYNSAFLTSEQGIICTTVSLTNSTAVVAELGSMPRIQNVKYDTLVKTTGSKNLLKLEEGHPHYNLVEPLSFGFKSLKILNCYIGIELQGKVCYLLNYLTKVGVNEIPFTSLKPSQRGEIVGTLHHGAPSHYFLSLDPDIHSKVILVQNIAFARKDRNRNAFSVEVDSHDILLWRQFNLFFGKICNNLKIAGQTISLAYPSTLQKVRISLPIAILFDRNSNPISWVNSKFDKVEIFGRESLAVARDIELYSNPSCFAFASPNHSFKIADNLSIERCILFNRGIYFLVEFHKLIAEISLFKESIEFRSSLQRKVFENSAFFGSNFINLQKDSTFHITNNIYMFAKLFNHYTRNSSPRFRMESPCEAIR